MNTDDDLEKLLKNLPFLFINIYIVIQIKII